MRGLVVKIIWEFIIKEFLAAIHGKRSEKTFKRVYLCLFTFLVDTCDLIYRNSTKGKSKNSPPKRAVWCKIKQKVCYLWFCYYQLSKPIGFFFGFGGSWYFKLKAPNALYILSNSALISSLKSFTAPRLFSIITTLCICGRKLRPHLLYRVVYESFYSHSITIL